MKQLLTKIKNIYYNHFSFNCFGYNRIFLESLMCLSNSKAVNIHCHALLNNKKWLYNGNLFIWRNNLHGNFISRYSIIELSDIRKIYIISKKTRSRYKKIINNIKTNGYNFDIKNNDRKYKIKF